MKPAAWRTSRPATTATNNGDRVDVDVEGGRASRIFNREAGGMDKTRPGAHKLVLNDRGGHGCRPTHLVFHGTPVPEVVKPKLRCIARALRGSASESGECLQSTVRPILLNGFGAKLSSERKNY